MNDELLTHDMQPASLEHLMRLHVVSNTGMCTVGQDRAVVLAMQEDKLMHTSQPNSWLLLTAGSCVGVKQPGPPSPWPIRTPGMIIACAGQPAVSCL